MSEFSLIERYFRGPRLRSDVMLSIGDDCALVIPEQNQALAISVDTLVEGVHFLPTVDPRSLGHKSLAVNLSDLAACGATPAWCTLAMSHPDPNESWLAEFMGGFFDLANQHQIELVGGDTTRGPLTITVQVIGTVPPNQALKRSTASAGDLVYVSGPVGNAGLGLISELGRTNINNPEVLTALSRPTPRIELGIKLRGLASACIDVSDGLAADLGHILRCSHVGATIYWERVPLSRSVKEYIQQVGDMSFPLCSGDDYELCFTIPPKHEIHVMEIFRSLGLSGARIGHIDELAGLRILTANGPLLIERAGYEHFH